MSAKLLLGQSVRLEVEVKDHTGTLVVGGGITLKIKKPDNTVETIETDRITENAVGKYSYVFLPQATGTYRVKWTTSTSNVGVVEDSFYIGSTVI